VRAFAALASWTPMTEASDYAVEYKYNKARVDQYNVELQAVKESSYIYAGTLATLRWCLTDIK